MRTGHLLASLPHSQFPGRDMLNHEMIAILAAHGLRIQKEQSFVLAGAEDLGALLPKLRLTKEGDEAFILIRPYIHSMAIYLRFEETKIKIVVFESQNWGWRYYPTRLIFRLLNDFFDAPDLILSGSELQNQDYQEGCTEYSLKFLDYCVQEGAGFFKDYAQKINCQPLTFGALTIYQLHQGGLPECLEELAMARNPKWFRTYQTEQLEKLDYLLTNYMNETQQLNPAKIAETVLTMQGYNLPAINSFAEKHPYDIELFKTDSTIHFQFKFDSKEAYYYGNFLLYSGVLYPLQIDTQQQQKSLFDGIHGFHLTQSSANFSLELKIDSQERMDAGLTQLWQQREQLYLSHMRQIGALTALLAELKMSLDLDAICQNGTGGFTQQEVQLALRGLFYERKEIYVPGIHMLAGAEACFSLNELQAQGYKHLAFSFQANNQHQIALWINLGTSSHQIHCYDSLSSESLTQEMRNRLQQLLSLTANDYIEQKEGLFESQMDDWSCGAHVFATIARLAGFRNPILDCKNLEVKQTARILYKYYKTQETLEFAQEEEREAYALKTKILLAQIEHYRQEQGYYLSNTENKIQDIFKPLADFLQISCWGNLDRRALQASGEQTGRAMEASSSTSGLSIASLCHNYPKEDQAGCLILKMASLPGNPQANQWRNLFDLIQLSQQARMDKKILDLAQMLAGELLQLMREGLMLKERLATILWQILLEDKQMLEATIHIIYQEDEQHYLAGINENYPALQPELVIYNLIEYLINDCLDDAKPLLEYQRRQQIERAAALRARHELTEQLQNHLLYLEIPVEEISTILQGQLITTAKYQLFLAIDKPLFDTLDCLNKLAFTSLLARLKPPLDAGLIKEAIQFLNFNDAQVYRLWKNWLSRLIVQGRAEENLTVCFSHKALFVFKEKFITRSQAVKLTLNELDYLINGEGFNWLIKGWLPLHQLIDLDVTKRQLLLLPQGLSALNNNWLSIEDVNHIDCLRLQIILEPNGIELLQKGFLAAQEINKLSSMQLAFLLHPQGFFNSFKKNSITLEQISSLSATSLEPTLTPLEIYNLIRGHISPLFISAQYGQIKMVAALLEHGAKVNVRHPQSYPPLYIAAQNGHLEIVNLLITHGAHVNACLPDGINALYAAAKQGQLRIVNHLLAHGAKINAALTNGCTALYVAIQEKQIHVAQALLDQGAAVNIIHTRNCATPLFIATQLGLVNIVKCLLEKGANLEAPLIQSVKELKRYARTQNPAIQRRFQLFIQAKLEDGAHPEAIPITPYQMACINDNQYIQHLLSKRGAKPQPNKSQVVYLMDLYLQAKSHTLFSQGKRCNTLVKKREHHDLNFLVNCLDRVEAGKKSIAKRRNEAPSSREESDEPIVATYNHS